VHKNVCPNVWVYLSKSITGLGKYNVYSHFFTNSNEWINFNGLKEIKEISRSTLVM
jgi:hypothetical protein